MGIKVAAALKAAIWDSKGTWIRSMSPIRCQNGLRDVTPPPAALNAVPILRQQRANPLVQGRHTPQSEVRRVPV
ncbi:hypothetical protein KC340_g61 [Hortaea werneckii]|nr:hypothetical protein KC340_g61 [Hortaea werneckii]